MAVDVVLVVAEVVAIVAILVNVSVVDVHVVLGSSPHRDDRRRELDVVPMA